MDKIGDILKKELEIKGMSQKEFAEKLYVTPQAVSKWIKGESRPTTDNVALINEVLGINLISQISRHHRSDRESSNDNMAPIELQELNDFEKAKIHAELILDRSRIKDKYSYPVYKLFKWLLPATIGLTYHQMLKHRNDPEEIYDYDMIFYNLQDYFSENIGAKRNSLYENQLEYAFYLMGMDLFESFDEYKIPNHDYCGDSMDYWYTFARAITKDPSSAVYSEFIIALNELIEFGLGFAPTVVTD